ncbi:hypothetical protein HPB47_027999 [Ixodes persulcatus]|uniref:Uncharacterized protein n=1 Tax=Ixodes persulcatus TaxID=34615 RepID=A0AC60PVV8_IXOPE|nr:hypothetical protein HPB47_027999 [Ixodes persulcatus]
MVLRASSAGLWLWECSRFWTPFTNRPTELNLEEFPSERLSKFVSVLPTATEQLQQLARDSSLTPEDSPTHKDPK